MDLSDIVLKKLPGGKFCMAGIEDEPMTLYQVGHLFEALAIPVEELAFALMDFKENPHRNEAYFGAVDGYFLYAK